MKLKNFILSSLMCMTAITTQAQKNLTVADLTTNYIFRSARVNTADMLKNDKQQAERYEINESERENIYRHSYVAVCSIKDNETGKTAKINGKIKAPTFSPDGKHVAFVRDNNLYLVNIEKLFGGDNYDDAETQVTTDGDFNKVINGYADWVYEEEFARTRMFCFTADGSSLAWIRFDESDVKQMTLQFFEKGSYPREYQFKYPKAGEDNARISVHSYEVATKKQHKITEDLSGEEYMPVIETIPEDNANVLLCSVNRHQDEMKLWHIACKTEQTKCVLTLNSKCYLPEEAVTNFMTYPDGFVVLNDAEGVMQPFLYNYNGELVRRLIADKSMIVTSFYGYNPKTKCSYFQAVGKNPMQRVVCMADKKGNVRELSENEGWNSADFSADFSKYVIIYSNKNTPSVYTLYNGKKEEVVETNEKLKAVVAEQTMAQSEFFTFTTSEGVELNGVIYKPADFNPEKKYPVIFHQYSGPGSQQVKDSWSMGCMGAGGSFEALLCQHGYICVTVDPRGTAARGADFQKLTYMKMGQMESKDQVEAALYMAKQPYVDANKIAIWGWSYGGFNTLMSMSEGRKVFCCGVAIAPPTDWRFYDSIYTERYMRTPQENPDGYGDNPIKRAEKLEGDLLLVHGLVDDNVHPQNSFEYTTKLVERGKQFDMHIFTNSNHSIYNGNSRRFLLEKVVKFFDKELAL